MPPTPLPLFYQHDLISTHRRFHVSQELEDERAELQQRLDALQEASHPTGQRTTLQGVSQSPTHAALQDSLEELEELRAQCRDKDGAITALEGQVQFLQDSVETLRQEAEEARARRSSVGVPGLRKHVLLRNFDDLMEDHTLLHEQHEALEGTVQELQATRAELQQRLDALQEASQSPAGEAALQRTIRELQAERAGLQARLDTMQAASKSAAHAAVEGELRELEAERATLQEQLEAMQDASRAWEVQRAELHEQQRTAMEAQASLESTVQQLEAEARQQQPQLQDLQRELEGARAAADAKWSCIVQQKDHQLSLLHTKTTQLQQGLRQLQAQHKEEQESLRQQLEVRHQQEQVRGTAVPACHLCQSRTTVACARASPGEDSVDQIPVHKIRHHSVAIVAAW